MHVRAIHTLQHQTKQQKPIAGQRARITVPPTVFPTAVLPAMPPDSAIPPFTHASLSHPVA